MKTPYFAAIATALCVSVISTAALAADSGEAVFKQNNCRACHAIDKKSVGPSLKDIATKYAGDKGAQAKLEMKTRRGGSGSFGNMPMPATAGAVSDGDIKAMVTWILSPKTFNDIGSDHAKGSNTNGAVVESAVDDHKAPVNTYENEKEADLVRSRNLQQIDARVNSINSLLKTANDNLMNFQKEAEVWIKAGKPIPATLKDDLQVSQARLDKLKQDLEKAHTEKAVVSSSNPPASNSSSSAKNSNWQSARTCDGQCVLLVAETKCKHIKNNQDNLSCLMQNGLGMKNDTPEICAQAKSLTVCMTKAEKLAAKNSSETATSKKYRYGSVCERNIEKIQNVVMEKNLPQSAASYDLFLKDIHWYRAKIAEPCTGSSAEAARAYKVSMDEYNKINQYCAGSHPKYTCTQWGANGDSYANANQAHYAAFKAEVDKALSDPDYSADLGTVTGSGAVNAADAACAASLKTIENQYSAAQRDIPKNSVVVLSEANMWRIAATLEKIKAQCPQSERYKAEAASIQSSYDEIKRVCDATASTPPCKPRLPGKEPVPVQAGNLLPELRKESTPDDCSGINWIQCRKRECMDRKGTFKVARGCAICITGQGGDWTRCPEGSGGVSSGQ